MPNSTVGIQVDDPKWFENPYEVYIDPRSVQALQIPVHRKIALEFGKKKRKVRIQKQSLQQPMLRVSQTLADEFRIPNGIQIHVRLEDRGRTLKLGPVLGILVSRYNRKKPGEPFGILSAFCAEVIAAARQKGVHAYVFTLNDMNYEKQTVQGWYHRNGRWRFSVFPLPNAVYNRLSFRKEEKRPDILQKLSKLKSYHIPVFNEMFLNKWQVYEALSSVPFAKTFIPYTELYKGYPSVKRLLNRYTSVYIKPADGSMGQGIFRISRDGGKYVCRYTTLNGSVKKTYSRLGPLLHQFSPRLSRRPYLVQQGLSLVKQNGSPVDFRSLVQKDRSGQWSITSIVARTGSSNSIVSNVAQGGTMVPARKLFSPSSPSHISRYTSYPALTNASKTICRALEKAMPGHYAELGIDLAVDRNGKVWLLEVNSKPSKTEDTIVEEKKLPRPSVLKLFDYTLYLNQIHPEGIQHKKLISYKRKLKKRRKKR